MAGADRFTSITNSTLYDKLSFNFIEGRHRCSCRPPKRKSPLEWGFFGMEPNPKNMRHRLSPRSDAEV
jgi:hypothetical protein